MTSPTWAFLDWPHPIPFAHRGGGAEQPENTMSAFAAAVDLGFRYLETDVRATADGVVLSFHDDDLAPTADRRGAIADLTFERVQRARVGGEPIPPLEELLAAWPETRIYVDAKDDASVVPLVALVDRTRSHDRVCLGSFYGRRVTRLRALTGGRVCTWMGRLDMARLRLASLGVPTGGFGSSCAQMPVHQGPVRVTDRRLLDSAHRKRVAVHVWTIDDRRQMEALLDLGVHGLLSNRPSLLKQVFCERGIWD